MTSASVPPADSPRELLSTVRVLTRQVRVAQRGTWFPLLVFAAITVASIPIYRFAPRHLGPCRPRADGGQVCTAVIRLELVYWPLALMLAYAVIARFYVNQSRRRGVGTPIRPYVITGVVIAVLLAAATLWRVANPLVPSTTQFLGGPVNRSFYDFATPAVAIGVALLVLAWVERSPLLLAYSVVYLAVVVVTGARIIHSSSQWAFLPNLLIPAAVLLLGSCLFALIRPKIEAPSQ